MISADHVRLMAKYNRWQNDSIYEAAGTLTDDQRRTDKGAFFGSVHGTLNHILWGDRMWMHRFTGSPKPALASIRNSKDFYEAWDDLCTQRVAVDDEIAAWAASLSEAWLQDDLSWLSGSSQSEVTKPRWVLVAHMFNHQTHHRGQVHCLLTGFGANPGDTDIPFMPT
ncbi:MAG: DinB family protein [Hyphomicrobiaceae bacterium]